jgi:hypothetical protein
VSEEKGWWEGEDSPEEEVGARSLLFGEFWKRNEWLAYLIGFIIIIVEFSSAF